MVCRLNLVSWLCRDVEVARAVLYGTIGYGRDEAICFASRAVWRTVRHGAAGTHALGGGGANGANIQAHRLARCGKGDLARARTQPVAPECVRTQVLQKE